MLPSKCSDFFPALIFETREAYGISLLNEAQQASLERASPQVENEAVMVNRANQEGP